MDGLDLGGVVGGNRELGGLHDSSAGLSTFTNAQPDSSNLFNVGVPTFSLFSSAPAEQQQTIQPAPIVAPPGASSNIPAYGNSISPRDLSRDDPHFFEHTLTAP